jgi:dihydropteroate synthase
VSDIYLDIVNSASPTIMGILNVTPDSFSDGGKYLNIENAVTHAKKLLNDGAEIIDIGGESTKPGALPVSVDEELNRVIPVIKKICLDYPGTRISIDTTKSKVAEEAIKSGACLINDISGGTFDPRILDIASTYEIPFVIMHIKGNPSNMQDSPYYNDVINEISVFFEERLKVALEKNVNKIILDPGIGFGKRIQDNYAILNNISSFNKFGYPILVGVSNKSFLGKSLNLEIDERKNSTIIAETIAVKNGANIIRTHNVKNAVELKKMMSLLTSESMAFNV